MSKKRYTEEFKIEALKIVESLGFTKAAAELGVTAKSLRTWSEQKASIGSAKLKSLNKVTDLEVENRRLKKENKQLRDIAEVLKKSTAIFSKDHIGDSK